MEFKGTKGKWECIFTKSNNRAVRNRGNIIATIYRPIKYNDKQLRYEEELQVSKCNQKIISAAPELLNALQKTDNDLGILSIQVRYLEELNPRIQGLSNLIKNWKDRNKKVIKKALI